MAAENGAGPAGPATDAELSHGAALAAAAAGAAAAMQPPREVVNVERLTEALDTAVVKSKGNTLAELTRKLSSLRHIQYEHRDECDKAVVAGAMLEVL